MISGCFRTGSKCIERKTPPKSRWFRFFWGSMQFHAISGSCFITGRMLAQFGAKWRQIGTSGALREKCSENTPQKSMIPFLLRYQATSCDQRFIFYKWAQFGAIWRNNAPKWHFRCTEAKMVFEHPPKVDDCASFGVSHIFLRALIRVL